MARKKDKPNSFNIALDYADYLDKNADKMIQVDKLFTEKIPEDLFPQEMVNSQMQNFGTTALSGVDNPDKIDPHLLEFGGTGLNQYGGLIYEEQLRQLQGTQGAKIYREMADNDDAIGAFLFLIDMYMRQVDWEARANRDGGREAQEVADFIYSCMHDMSQSWTETDSESNSMLEYGYAPMEIVYKQRRGDSEKPYQKSQYDDSMIGWRKISCRAQSTIYRWLFDNDGGIQGCEQVAPPHWTIVTIPITKMLLFRTRTRLNNPQGRSILRNCYPLWHYKRRFMEIEAIGVERDLAGLPMIGVPPEYLSPSASAEKKYLVAALTRIVQNVRRNEREGLVLPHAFDANGNKMFPFELLASGSARRQFDITAIINRLNASIMRTCLTDFLMLGHEKTGSFALSSNKTDMFAVAMGAWLKMKMEVWNNYGVVRLMKLNGLDPRIKPEIWHSDLEKPNLTELGAYISALSMSGMPMFPSTELENFLLRAAGLPERDINAEPAIPKDTEEIITDENGMPVDTE